MRTPRDRLASSLSRWLPPKVAIERSGNIAAAILSDREVNRLCGVDPDDGELSVSEAVREMLGKHNPTEEQLVHAIKAWDGEGS